MQMEASATTDPTLDALLSKVAELEEIASATFPEVLLPLKAALAVAAIGCLSDNTQPTALVFIGPSGAGKTLAIQMLAPQGDEDPVHEYVYRSDKFTAASFVTHVSDRTKKELVEIDLLPRIENRTLLTPEMGSFFQGKKEVLGERFAVIARVLDGEGYVSDSGVHGRRGYDRRINFQWIGATTPLSDEAVETMAGVGPRMVFYDVDRPRKTTAELAELARRPSGPSEDRLHQVTREYLALLYAAYPPRTLPISAFLITDEAATTLALLAEVVARLRVPIRPAQGDDARSVGDIEYPERVLSVLRNIAIGSALVHLRSEIVGFDLTQVRHIALSSGARRRSAVFRALLASGGTATSSQIERHTGMSRPTVLEGMRDLHAVGLATLKEGGPRAAAILRLNPEYAALIDGFTE